MGIETGGDNEKGHCSQNVTGCTLRPCREDAAMDSLYLNKIINSAPLSLVVSCSAHPALRRCSQVCKETASWVASPSKSRREVQLCSFQLSCTHPGEPVPLTLHLCTAALCALGEGSTGVDGVADPTSTGPACSRAWHFGFLELLFAKGITLFCGSVWNLFWTRKNLM